ncbi:hypothetical protein PFLUV_G00199390 [Perca fluviatilis]|uniref:Transmembrane protein 230 n=1 Tax=Perca fluviatilis TaxID=8168 RepID=A0A6A5EG96_PERFL|nr:hypothetical protein PFLUV_G00199390 [Perca fluviatilis]
MQAIRSNMLGAGISNNKVKYSRLAADDDGYIDLQFKKSPPKVPYKAIALAIFLFLIGSLLIIFGLFFCQEPYRSSIQTAPFLSSS